MTCHAMMQLTLMMLRTVLTKYGVLGSRVVTSPLRMCTAILMLLPPFNNQLSDELVLSPEPACSGHTASSAHLSSIGAFSANSHTITWQHHKLHQASVEHYCCMVVTAVLALHGGS
jgi:hypothetical protein